MKAIKQEMKYFTIDWWVDGQDLKNCDSGIMKPVEDYKNYLTSIKSKLPPSFISFEEKYFLHDATLLQLNLNKDVLTIDLYAYESVDGKTGEEKTIQLQYEGVTNFSSKTNPDQSLPGPEGYGDLGYDEIEVLEGNIFEHRFLFSSGIEMSVRFSNFAFEVLD